MLTSKLKIFIILLSSVAYAAIFDKTSEQFNSLELEKIEPLLSEEANLKPKANWLPICQEVLINELESQAVVPESEVIFLPQDIPGIVISPGRSQSDTCIAPNGGGLTTFLRKAYELLPHERINALKQKAARDPQVQKFVQFLKSENFRHQLSALFKTNAYVVLRDYACHMLYLDIDELLQIGESLFEPKDSTEPAEISQTTTYGVQGLLADIKDAIPVDEILHLLKQKLAEDVFLSKAKDLMKSPEFIGIVKAVEDQPEYIALIKALRENGFKLDFFVEYARNFIN